MVLDDDEVDKLSDRFLLEADGECSESGEGGLDRYCQDSRSLDRVEIPRVTELFELDSLGLWKFADRVESDDELGLRSLGEVVRSTETDSCWAGCVE